MSPVLAALVGAVLGQGAPQLKDKKPDPPVLFIDEAHQHATGNDKALIYEVPACTEFIIDASKYVFSMPAELKGLGLNAIQIITGPGQTYVVPWVEGKQRYLVSPKTAHALSGSGAFTGLPEGRRVIIGIGRSDEHAQFGVVWAGLVDVKPPRPK